MSDQELASKTDQALATLQGRDLQPDRGQVRTYVAATFTGKTEIYQGWGGGPELGWCLLCSRYLQSQPRLLASFRPFLARGCTIVILPPSALPPEIPEPGDTPVALLVDPTFAPPEPEIEG